MPNTAKRAERPARRCLTCGEGTFQPKDIRGMAFAYRDEQALRAEDSLVLPVCTHCGETRLNGEETDALDTILEKAYQTKRHHDAVRYIERLLEAGFSQTDIEHAISLSPGYVSKVRRGEKRIKGSTLRELVMLASHPRENVHALAELYPELRGLESKIARASKMAHA